MKSRASTHLLIILAIILLTAIGSYGVYRAAFIRGYEPSLAFLARNLLLFVPFLIIPIVMTRITRFSGSWTVYTTAILLFSLGAVGQYRLFSDPEYVAKGRAAAREAKQETLQLRYIHENYSPEKKQMVGLPAEPPTPTNLDEETRRESSYGISEALLDRGNTWIPLIAILGSIGAYFLFRRDKTLNFIQQNGFLIVLITILPLIAAAVTSRSGKVLGNMTPWELSKVPFLLGFAAILAVLYQNLSKTTWGVPKASALVPLIFIGALPFVPFLLLKDFGQMMVFVAAYVTLYLIAVKRFLQRFVFIGAVLLVVGIFVTAALPDRVQEKIPLLPTFAKPLKSVLPPRIHQRFHLWFDGFNPPDAETFWWRDDLAEFYESEYSVEMRRKYPETGAIFDKLADKNTPSGERAELRKQLRVFTEQEIDYLRENEPEVLEQRNIEAWFSDDALQSSQATFGLASGGKTGRGLGLGYPELIPVADSDYIYAALGEELGLFGGLLITVALIIFVFAGTRIAIDARDMFTKLCAAGSTAFIGFQALVNIGGITRALPMTGITLPFVSHGGFSLITAFFMLGILLAVSHRNSAESRLLIDESHRVGDSPNINNSEKI